MSRKLSPIVCALPPLLGCAALASFVFVSGKRGEEEVPVASAPDDVVLEFRLVGGTRLDAATRAPIYPEALAQLNGKPVIIVGHMTETRGAFRPGDYRRFRLVEKAPRMWLRPPAANEGIFVEQRWPEAVPVDADHAFPSIEGALTVRGRLRLVGYEGSNPGLEEGYWFAIEDAVIDPHGVDDKSGITEP